MVLTPAMQALVQAQRLGFVATVCSDGTPNLSPRGTLAVWDDQHLVFADICSPGTTENLRHNPAIEINVVDPIGRHGYRFKGHARLIESGADLARAIAFYRARGTISPIQAVVLVRVERALPVRSPAYAAGQSEPEIRAQWRAYYGALDDATTPT